MVFIILGAIVSLVILIIFANLFANIAEDKGYNRSGYFWLCFFLGALGYLMVCALPDKKLRDQVAALMGGSGSAPEVLTAPKTAQQARAAALSAAAAYSAAPAAVKSGPGPQLPGPDEWKCVCGRINKNYVSSCGCGKSKREVFAARRQS